MTDENSLFKRLGGKEIVESVVQIMFKKIHTDPLLIPIFKDFDTSQKLNTHIAFLAMCFDAPNKYEGKDMRAAHAGIVKERGLSDEHFNALAGHLKSSLEDVDIPKELITEVLIHVEKMRNDVLSKAS